MKLRHFAFLLPLALLAQDAAQQTATKKEEPKKEEAKKKDEKAEAPAPAVEKALTTFLDVGYRWVGFGGSTQTYRSIVNNNEGIRLVGLQMDYVGKSKIADEFHLSAYNVGDPYDSARFNIRKRGIYEYDGRYSSVYYYNYLPSFANPQLPTGYYIPSVAYDTVLRNYDNELTLMPGKRIVPYVGFTRNSSFGDGIMPLVMLRNEYPLRNKIQWSQDNVYGGVRFEWTKWHATLEQGATRFRDDQNMYSTERLPGNVSGISQGQPLPLENALQAYGIRGSGYYSKILTTANPFPWLDLYGQFLYSDPAIDANYTRNANGRFYAGSPSYAYFPSNQDQLYGNASQPHSSGMIAGEARFWKVRIRQSWETDRFHTSGWATLNSLYFSPTQRVEDVLVSNTLLVVNNTRAETLGFLDLSKKFTFRGGYRYESGDTTIPSGLTSVTSPYEYGKLKRNVGIAGFTARPWERFTWNADFEHGDASQVYYRTSLADYTRFRTQVRYQMSKDLTANGIYNCFRNKNNAAGLNQESQQFSLNLQYMPASMKWFSILADYTRSSIYSSVPFYIPASLTLTTSVYRDNDNVGTLMVDLKPAGKHAPQVSAGGSFITTSGSRPTRYYQPLGRVVVPLSKRLQGYVEWRWYGYAQPFYPYEGFRSHQILSGIRLLL
jgi:hypothetical protein